MEELLKQKTQSEKADIKSSEILKYNFVGKFKRGKNIEIEIVSIKKIDKGIDLKVKAWRNDKQISFGDGTVEIETFKIYNPPILVDDPLGTIIRNYTDPYGVDKQRKLREDPIEAILQTLEHNLSVIKTYDDSKMVKGKIGKTTSTFYPDAGSGGTTVDGQVAQDSATQYTWADIIALSAGNVANTTDTTYGLMYYRSSATTDRFKILKRTILTFDTSAIGSGSSISSAVLSFYGTSKGDDAGNSPNIDIYTSTPASNNNVVTGDFDQIGSTSQTGSPISFASYNDAGYNDFTFNATGISNISLTGISKFGTRNANYDVAAVQPTWGGDSLTQQVTAYSADQTGTSNDPKLVVTYSASSAIKTIDGLAKASVKTVNGLAIASVKTWDGLA